ncbi:MAG: hypothetical protein WC634_00245 [archaeon]
MGIVKRIRSYGRGKRQTSPLITTPSKRMDLEEFRRILATEGGPKRLNELIRDKNVSLSLIPILSELTPAEVDKLHRAK